MTGVPLTGAARRWRRYTWGESLARFAIYLLAVAAIVASLRSVQVIPEFIADAPEQMRDLLQRMWPVDVGYYKGGIHEALLDSIHIAVLGTALAVLMAVPVGFLAAHNVTPSHALNYLAKFILVATRSVNTLVWALFFVAVFGPGALAGTLAIAFHSIGFCGKLLGEALEEAQAGPVEALRAAGAPWLSIALKGYWPQIKPAFWAIVLFRFDINVRESAVLGLVGAGGVGMVLDSAINLFQWPRVAMVLLAVLIVVVLVEVATTQLRRRII
jgi:phosphonate transport system permease protein